jgi:fructokinase
VIVVAGESLVDVRADGTESVGGSPLNVAVGLARLDVPALLVTELGDDDRGARARAHLLAAGVEVDASPARRTSVAAVLPGDEPTYRLDATWTLPGRTLPACDALHVGSLGTVLEPGRDSVLDLVEQAWARDVPVSYDPNVRGPLLDDPEQGRGDVEALAARAALVKLSEQDVALLWPGADPDDIARSLLGEATRLVVLTRGAAGATAFSAQARADVAAPAVAVVDTVGAGDAFTAGLLAHLYDGDALSAHAGGLPADPDALTRALQVAVAVAAEACARAGA